MAHSCTRRDLLAWGSVGLVGTTVGAGVLGAPAQARPRARVTGTGLHGEVRDAGDRHGVPAALLLAMGYVNTRLEMPPAELCEFRMGDPEARGAYGVMALVRNPWEDTLGLASELTGLTVDELTTDRAANFAGGAALLARSQGAGRPSHPGAWLGAVAGQGGDGPLLRASAGVGAGDDYAEQVGAVLANGFVTRLLSGEQVSLLPVGGV
jgi:hypothetical protein